VACDSYHRYKEDVELAKRLNLQSYRFSISWPRIQANGSGAPNQRGIDYYKRLVDALLEAKIRPLATLYHWDLPQALQDNGGWPNRDTADRFVEYCEIMTRALGDRVNHWCIFNEPWVFTTLGYRLGTHAPGHTDQGELLHAIHVVNIAQGKAFRAIKAVSPKFQVGTAFSMTSAEPATDAPEDREAAERGHAFFNLIFLHTALKGQYPPAFPPTPEMLGVRPGDMELVRAPLDFLGINYYTRGLFSRPGHSASAPLGFERASATQGPLTDNGWEVWPDGFYRLVMQITREYGKPVIEITENGCSYTDAPDANGAVPDGRKIDFYRGYLSALARAMKDGANVRGFHAWSLLDNFEWEQGYTQRFGLVYVDFRSQKRTIKDSGRWYAKLAASGDLT
jgi:beta-glucosidase